jgi:hypothetical protein
MNHAEHKTGFGTRVRRTWNALMRVFEAIERNPMDDVLERLDRLERDRRAPK